MFRGGGVGAPPGRIAPDMCIGIAAFLSNGVDLLLRDAAGDVAMLKKEPALGLLFDLDDVLLAPAAFSFVLPPNPLTCARNGLTSGR